MANYYSNVSISTVNLLILENKNYHLFEFYFSIISIYLSKFLAS